MKYPLTYREFAEKYIRVDGKPLSDEHLEMLDIIQKAKDKGKGVYMFKGKERERFSNCYELAGELYNILMSGNIAVYGLARSKKPQEVEILKEIFGENLEFSKLSGVSYSFKLKNRICQT